MTLVGYKLVVGTAGRHVFVSDYYQTLFYYFGTICLCTSFLLLLLFTFLCIIF